MDIFDGRRSSWTQDLKNRITISYNRKGHRAFAVFLLSIFVGKCRRAVSDMRCRSPPLHLDFLHFKNSDGRYLW